jgi:hypothetical protein
MKKKNLIQGITAVVVFIALIALMGAVGGWEMDGVVADDGTVFKGSLTAVIVTFIIAIIALLIARKVFNKTIKK